MTATDAEKGRFRGKEQDKVGVNDNNEAVGDDDSARRRTERAKKIIYVLLGFLILGFAGLAAGLAVGLTSKDTSEVKTTEFDPNVGGMVTKPPRNNFIPIAERTDWPELVGETVEQANATIHQMYGDEYAVEVVLYGKPVTGDYRTDRVRLYLNKENKVLKAPNVG
jgi:hypothetical protein